MAYTVNEESKQLVGYAIPLYHANKSTIFFLENPIFHARTKHVEIHYHFIREKVSQWDIGLEHIKIEHQIADLFTKCSIVNKRISVRI